MGLTNYLYVIPDRDLSIKTGIKRPVKFKLIDDRYSHPHNDFTGFYLPAMLFGRVPAVIATQGSLNLRTNTLVTDIDRFLHWQHPEVHFPDNVMFSGEIMCFGKNTLFSRELSVCAFLMVGDNSK